MTAEQRAKGLARALMGRSGPGGHPGGGRGSGARGGGTGEERTARTAAVILPGDQCEGEGRI